MSSHDGVGSLWSELHLRREDDGKSGVFSKLFLQQHLTCVQIQTEDEDDEECEGPVQDEDLSLPEPDGLTCLVMESMRRTYRSCSVLTPERETNSYPSRLHASER